MKRAFDICLGCLAALLLFVPVLLVAMAILFLWARNKGVVTADPLVSGA